VGDLGSPPLLSCEVLLCAKYAGTQEKDFNAERFIQVVWEKYRMIRHFPIDYSSEFICARQKCCRMSLGIQSVGELDKP
jgi:hypothetical protein